MNLFKAISLKLVSALLFAFLSAFIRYLGETGVPVGQSVFFRSAFAIIPVVLIYAWRRELMSAVVTSRPLGHLGRGAISVAGMFLNFAALARLPLVDATAISFAAPLITVAFAAWFLGERVRIYRWSAVGVGFIGVIVMLWPYLDFAQFSAEGAAAQAAMLGAIFALMGAFTNAGAVVQTAGSPTPKRRRRSCSISRCPARWPGLQPLPLGWVWPTGWQLAALIGAGLVGGTAHIVLTESYRYAPASMVAPFDYTTMVWAFVLGYWMFGEVPTVYVYIGAAIVAASGLFVIWRERQLGLRREAESEGPANVS